MHFEFLFCPIFNLLTRWALSFWHVTVFLLSSVSNGCECGSINLIFTFKTVTSSNKTPRPCVSDPGESGLGKSTLVNSLFLTDLHKDRKLLNAEGESSAPCLQFQCIDETNTDKYPLLFFSFLFFFCSNPKSESIRRWRSPRTRWTSRRREWSWNWPSWTLLASGTLWTTLNGEWSL